MKVLSSSKGDALVLDAGLAYSIVLTEGRDPAAEEGEKSVPAVERLNPCKNPACAPSDPPASDRHGAAAATAAVPK